LVAAAGASAVGERRRHRSQYAGEAACDAGRDLRP
jgi:hypothetical protein